MNFFKARNASDWYGIAVEDDLDAGEALAGDPEVRILRYGEVDSPGYIDVTEQFGADLQAAYDTVTTSTGEQKDGVRFFLSPAEGTEDQIPAREYRVEVKYSTDGGRSPVALIGGTTLPRLVVV